MMYYCCINISFTSNSFVYVRYGYIQAGAYAGFFQGGVLNKTKGGGGFLKNTHIKNAKGGGGGLTPKTPPAYAPVFRTIYYLPVRPIHSNNIIFPF